MSESAQGPGEALKAAREALNVSEREVADALNLPLNVIQAMEADDFEALPPPVFTRGYLRSYARLLELDDDELVSRLPQSAEDEVVLTGEMAPVSAKSLPVDRSLLLGGGIAAVVLLVILLVVGLGSDDEQAPDTQAPVVAEEPAASTQSELTEAEMPASPAADAVSARPQPAQPDVSRAEQPLLRQSAPAVDTSPTPEDARQAPTSAPETQTTSLEDAAAAAQSSASSDPAEATSAAATTASSAAASAATPPQNAAESAQAEPDATEFSDPTPAGMRRITPFGDDVLVISFTEDCWVDVKDRDGTRLFGDLIRGGRTIALIGTAPYQILLGYAPGAQLRFNDEVIDLDAVTRNNVARLTVGG